LYPQSLLALSAIYLTTRLSTPPIALPLSPVPWWTLFDASETDILICCSTLLELYADWKGESIWIKAGRLPVDKAGVRGRLVDGVVGAKEEREIELQ
jgi:hypothetical protein